MNTLHTKMLPTFPLLPVTNNPHYRCGVFPPGKLCLFDSIHMTETDLKHADSMMPFALPVIANLQQKWVTSSEIWWSCPILCCGSVPKWWVNAFTDSEKKSLELLVAHRRSCSTALFNCFRGSIMVSFPNGSCHLHQCSFAWFFFFKYIYNSQFNICLLTNKINLSIFSPPFFIYDYRYLSIMTSVSENPWDAKRVH